MYDKKEIIEMYFKDHKVDAYHKFQGNTESNRDRLISIEFLRWEEPGTTIGWIDYVVKDSTLFVSGDMGEAVYRWYGGEEINMEWMAQTDFEYFKSKCKASEVGWEFDVWSEKAALEYIEKYNKEAGEKVPVTDDLKEALFSQVSWTKWLEDFGFPCFGDDYMHYSDIGMVEHVRCFAHWVGLKEAVKQLKQRQ